MRSPAEEGSPGKLPLERPPIDGAHCMPRYRRVSLRIALFGHFGAGNFGNESTLQAMLCNLRRLIPDAELVCICSNPQKVTSEYNIPAVPINGVVIRRSRIHNRVARLMR